MIHQPLSPSGVHPQISSCLRLLFLCLVLKDLFVIHYYLFIFQKEKKRKKLSSFIGSHDKCHTSVFNALIFKFMIPLLDLYIVCLAYYGHKNGDLPGLVK